MAFNEDKWIDDKLGALSEIGAFEPNTLAARARIEQRASTRRKVRWGATAVVAAFVLLTVFPAPRASAGRVLNKLFVMEVHQAPARPIGVDFALTDSTGKTVKLSDFRGKTVLLNFWATWCVPCQHEVPWFVEFQSQMKDFTVLGVALDEEGWKAVRPFMEQRHVNYPVMLAAPVDLPAPYSQIGALPMTYLIDREGRVAGTYNSLASKDAYEGWIRSVLDEPAQMNPSMRGGSPWTHIHRALQHLHFEVLHKLGWID